jgi:glycosyltransferase involved in cell wall biosynthesis
MPPVPHRILLLITDLKIGGTPTVVRELAIRLHNDPDLHVHVACLDTSGPVADQLRSRGIPVTTFDAKSRLDFDVPKRLLRLIRGQDIQTVFSFLVHANAVAALVSPLLPGIRFLQSIQTTQRQPKWHWKVQHLAAFKAEKIVVPSRSVAQAATDRSGINPAKIVIIPNAVDPTEPLTPRRHPGKDIGFIGRLDPIKRIGDLIQAMPMTPPDATLHIYGEGPELQHLEKLVTENRLTQRVIFHGEINTPWQALANLDVLVLPSEAEGFGLVLIEAMAASVPVVASNAPGIQDVIIDQQNGVLSKTGNPESIANAITQILDDNQFRDRLVAGGLKSVDEKYNWTAIYKLYRNLLIPNVQ